MPKVLSYTPAWLSRPAPGFEFIASYDGLQKKHDAPRKTSGTTPAVAASKDAYLGARRTIASRGTEVFTAVGNEIRWADLRVLKDRWEDQVHSKPNGSEKPVENAPPAVHKVCQSPPFFHVRLFNRFA
jgi:nucleoporin NUP82